MTGRILLGLLVLLASATAGRAGLARVDLDAVEIAPAPGARLPADVVLQTAAGATVTPSSALAGKPALMVPFDPGCRTICGPALSILSAALAETKLVPGRDYRILLVAIGGRAETSARAFLEGQAGPAVTSAATLVVGPPDGVGRLLDAVGYRYAPDPGNAAVAHPSGFLALAADGRVSRVLTSLALTPEDLRLALLEAGEGRIGSLADRVRLLCYGFDAVHGVYTSRVQAVLQAGGVLTVIALAGGLWLLSRHRSGGRPA